MIQTISDEQILGKIQEIVHDAMRIDSGKIIPEARLFTDLGAESLDILDIRFRIQEMFGFEISDGEVIRRLGENLTTEEIEEKLTVKSLLDYVKQRLLEKEAS
jgi:acyl carrier protein